ncbi:MULTISPECIES: hypothetical protein [unclassified Nostoc]|uniref:hypothetical protein n=1 Tax=unclassified Nostoc TaxID=2593658 RepID=UPI0015C308C5|nr:MULTISPECIES: hypothetical protein [unclassified Nostoc]MBD2525633.1 hypothetical protein [Nostoc sp. FACHB-133]QLE53695.1 hypothetical protein FD724_38220 [Nostoc sp. C057]
MYSSSDRLDAAKQLQSAQRVTAQLEAEVKQLRQSNNQLEQVNNQLDIANKQLQQEKAAMETTAQQAQTVTLNVTELDSWLEKKIIEVVNKVTQGIAIAPATTATPAKIAPSRKRLTGKPRLMMRYGGAKRRGQV